MTTPTARLALALGFLIAFAAPCLAGPNVVVTIKPVHSLAAAILEGIAEPKLLLDGAASPHSYALKPSDAEALSNADAIVRVSENLEVFLDKAIGALPGKARVIDLDKTPGLTLLPVRRDGGFMQETGEESRGASPPRSRPHRCPFLARSGERHPHRRLSRTALRRDRPSHMRPNIRRMPGS